MTARLIRATAAGISTTLVAGAAALAPAEARASGAAAAPSTAASATVAAATHDDRLPRGRRIVRYTVKPGDTATELAVRFHAWTRELIRHNHLGRHGHLYVGQRLEIPVVVRAARKERRAKAQAPQRSWRHADPSRERVRQVIAHTARRHGVDPQLALAVSWQEAGWQMHHVSSADAIGAMQVLPSTGIWMSMYAGRPLRLHRLRDNALAGVLLLRVLDRHTRSTRHQVAAYYQGLGAVRRYGLYPETKRYVANVRAIRDRLERGLPPR